MSEGICVETLPPIRPKRGSAWLTCCVLALLGIIIILFYTLNTLHPLAGDDYSYSFIFGRDNRVATFLDALQSQRLEWHAWNGRPLANGLAQCFLIFDKSFFNIANTIALIGLVVTITRLVAQRTRSGKLVAFSVVLSLFLLGTPVPGDTLLWLDGSCNNLWLLLLITVFLLLALSGSWKLQLPALLMAPFVGSAHEGMSIGLVGFLLLYTLLTEKKKLSFLHYLIIAAVIAGLILRFQSPGLYNRIGVEGSHATAWVSMCDKYLLNNKILLSLRTLVGEEPLRSFPSPFMLSAAMLGTNFIALLCRMRKRLDKKNIMLLSLAGAALLQTGAILCSGMLFDRVWMGVFYFSFLSLLVWLIPVIQRWNPCCRVLVSLLACTPTILMMLAAIPSARAHAEYAAQVVSAIRSGQRIVTLAPRHREMSSRPWFYDMGSAANCLYWANHNTARLYHADTFSLLCPEELQLVMSISEETIAQARSGDIVMLPDGSIFLFAPPHARRVRLFSTTLPRVPEDEGALIVWPMKELYGIIFRLPADDTYAHLDFERKDDTNCRIEIEAPQLEQLRRDAILPVEQVNR